jgi:hypothetical protein
MVDEDDWRLRIEPGGGESPGTLDRVLHRVRDPDLARQLGDAVGDEVALTHDGGTLFAYSSSEQAIRSARRAIEAAVHADGIDARMYLSRWDPRVDDWVQVDPPLTGDSARSEAAVEADDARVESRTMVTSAGKLVRAEVEDVMREWATKLDLRCEIIEHPHLLTTQVASTVTGPKRKIDEL